jgi:hypothetical protein
VLSAEADNRTIEMMPQPEPSTQEVLAGLVERVGQRNPTIVTLWHMTKALGVTLKTLFDEEKPRRRVSSEKN